MTSKAIARATCRLAGVVIAAGVANGAANAGVLDKLFGTGTASESARPAARSQREWLIRDYTTVRLVRREDAAAANQHPARINPDVLRQRLGQVRFVVAAGQDDQPLFDGDEVNELAGPLAQAFANAGPDDDVLLLSSARRGGMLLQPYAVTARLFVHNGGLQLIVNDARYEFFNQAVGSRTAPQFTYGSRSRASRTALLRSDAAGNVRPDWLAMPLAAAAPAQPAQSAPLGSSGGTPAGAAGVTPAASPPSAAVARPRDAAAVGEEVEQRLTVLKRLRDRNLITEQEYEQKRREILSQL